MTKRYPDFETRKQRRLAKLGTNNPICGMCGETYWRCIEEHHVADLGRDPTTVLLCGNCHDKLSDDQKDHPHSAPSADPTLDRIGQFLLGLADLLERLIERLRDFGRELIERAVSTTRDEGRTAK